MQEGKRYPAGAEPGLTWADSPAEARAIQKELRHRRIAEKTIEAEDIRHVAGADAAYSQDRIHAAVVVLTFPGLDIVEETCVVCKISFPYIPGLFSFREGPAIAAAFRSLATPPGLLLVHGHGYAHPERIGIASHLGIVLDVPTIGVAGRLLTGNVAMPGPARGSAEPVLDDNEVIGMAVRTLSGAKPVFVSAGHRVDLELAVGIALETARTHRITEPIWLADQRARSSRDSR